MEAASEKHVIRNIVGEKTTSTNRLRDCDWMQVAEDTTEF
jgi:hypothetical protein